MGRSVSSSSSLSLSRLSLSDRINAPLSVPRSPWGTSSSVRTSRLTVNTSAHGKVRRSQRRISKHQLRLALKHGKRTPLGNRSMYQYRDLVFIYDEGTKKEVTSYIAALNLPYHFVSRQEYQAHDNACRRIREDPDSCTSHSILLVDTSGSMRAGDVNGCKTRLAAVFLAIAQDFIKQRIEVGRGSLSDAITIILMGETPFLWMNAWPTDYRTYNTVLKAFKDGHFAPSGHCCYQPSLQLARDMFQNYNASTCQLVLALFSDGRPSDARYLRTSWDSMTQTLSNTMESLASQFGRRLSVQCVGMGSANQFATLDTLCQVARNFESTAELTLPSMTASSLGAAVSSIATSLTESQTDAGAAHRRQIRRVIREDRSKLPVLTEAVDNVNFDICTHVVRKVMSSSEGNLVEVPLQDPEARGVAIRKSPFAEGSERFAYQFFEVAADGATVVGQPLVAKECKFEYEHGRASQFDYTQRFVKRFCRLQRQAQKVAEAFNAKLDSIQHILDPDTPHVEFLHCSVYFLTKLDDYGREHVSVYVVEPRLFGRFQKWNSNNGWTKDRSPAKPVRALSSAAARMPLVSIIEEGSEEDMDIQPMKVPSAPFEEPSDENNKENVEVIDLLDNDDDVQKFSDESIFISSDEVAQAFSHFSYISERRNMLICDLQGVFDSKNRVLRLTDPVIHHFGFKDGDFKEKYGRTDRGIKGIEDFLDTHECCGLCTYMTKGFFPVKPSHAFQK